VSVAGRGGALAIVVGAESLRAAGGSSSATSGQTQSTPHRPLRPCWRSEVAYLRRWLDASVSWVNRALLVRVDRRPGKSGQLGDRHPAARPAIAGEHELGVRGCSS